MTWRIAFTAAIGAAVVAGSGSAWAQAAGQWRDGGHIYQQICQYCHESGVGPVLWGRDKDHELAPEYVVAMTRQGRAGMPAFRFTEIDDATLAKLGEIIATNQKSLATGGKP